MSQRGDFWHESYLAWPVRFALVEASHTTPYGIGTDGGHPKCQDFTSLVVLAGGGDMGRRIKGFDWSVTRL